MLSTALREIFDKEEYYEKEVECLLVFYRRNVIVHRYELMYCGMRRGSKNPPVKVSDGASAELSVGETETFAVADFIAANGSPVTAESSDDAVATAAVAEDILTITAVAAGEADVSLICGEVTVTFDVTITSAAEPMEPVKVKDGVDFELAIGEDRVFTISEYITANGNEVTASSSDPDKVSAAVAEDALTITAEAEGEAIVTLSCADISVTFQVTVYRTYTVSVDGVDTQVRSGAEFTLPQASVPEDQNLEFVAWQVGGERKQPGEKITVNSDLVITSVTQRKAPVKVKDGEGIDAIVGEPYTIDVADYITTYGNEVKAESDDTRKVTATIANGTLTLTPQWAGSATVTLSCGSVRVEFAVTIKAAEVAAPVFKNGTIFIDLFEQQSGSYEFSPTSPDSVDYDYQYSVTPVAGVRIDGNTLTFTAEKTVEKLVLTINVIATASVTGETVEKTASFTVTVNVTDSTPRVIEEEITVPETVDLYEGAYTIDLSANIQNAKNVEAYTVNDSPVDGASYAITGSFTDEAQDVTLTIVAKWDDRSISYVYNISVMDSTAYRMPNGGFDDDLNGWTVEATLDGAENDDALGGISTEGTYWAQKIPFNNDGKFFSGLAVNAEERAVGTLTSPVFTVGGSGWITYKLGGARDIEKVYMQIVSSDGSKTVTLPNFDWSDAADSVTVRGCTLVSYKANLIEYGFAPGKKVYIRITDNGTRDYGLFFLDSVITYYPDGSEPDDTFRLVSKYRILNGGFETGNLTGWTMEGDIGVVSADKTYWNNAGNTYEQDGTYLFTWWSWNSQANEGQGAEVKREENTGTLKSSIFTLKADAIVSFLFGGGVGNTEIYLEFVNADTNEVIAVFRNDQGRAKEEGRLVRYCYQFNELSEDTECYLRVTDNATSSWGCFTLDGVEVNRTSIPEGFHPAVNQISVTEE